MESASIGEGRGGGGRESRWYLPCYYNRLTYHVMLRKTESSEQNEDERISCWPAQCRLPLPCSGEGEEGKGKGEGEERGSAACWRTHPARCPPSSANESVSGNACADARESESGRGPENGIYEASGCDDVVHAPPLATFDWAVSSPTMPASHPVSRSPRRSVPESSTRHTGTVVRAARSRHPRRLADPRIPQTHT